MGGIGWWNTRFHFLLYSKLVVINRWFKTRCHVPSRWLKSSSDTTNHPFPELKLRFCGPTRADLTFSSSWWCFLFSDPFLSQWRELPVSHPSSSSGGSSSGSVPTAHRLFDSKTGWEKKNMINYSSTHCNQKLSIWPDGDTRCTPKKCSMQQFWQSINRRFSSFAVITVGQLPKSSGVR